MRPFPLFPKTPPTMPYTSSALVHPTRLPDARPLFFSFPTLSNPSPLQFDFISSFYSYSVVGGNLWYVMLIRPHQSPYTYHTLLMLSAPASFHSFHPTPARFLILVTHSSHPTHSEGGGFLVCVDAGGARAVFLIWKKKKKNFSNRNCLDGIANHLESRFIPT